MTSVLIDTNVILDIIAGEAPWSEWSRAEVARVMERGRAIINAVIFAEVSVGLPSLAAVENKLPRNLYVREPIPFEAGFLAGKAFLAYRRRGGRRTAPLPDFFIGAHALVAGYALLTRDPRRYRRDFPKLHLIAPALPQPE